MTKLDNILSLAKEAHNGKYTYDAVKFTGMTHKIEVTCGDHGPFWVTPAAHINHKVGCPVCSTVVAVEEPEAVIEEPEAVIAEVALEEPEVALEEPEVATPEPLSYFKKKR
jgi:hypothetical protein